MYDQFGQMCPGRNRGLSGSGDVPVISLTPVRASRCRRHRWDKAAYAPDQGLRAASAVELVEPELEVAKALALAHPPGVEVAVTLTDVPGPTAVW